MSLLTPKTDLEKDLAEKDASILRCAEAAHNMAVVLKNENDRFWAVPTDRLLNVLNHNTANTLATFAINTATANAVNAALNEVNSQQFTTRAPNTPGRDDITFDGDKFIQTQTNNNE
jgi:hypothetical protein